MPLDNPQYPNALNPSNPQNSDNAGQGAAHLRKLTAVVRNAFANIAGPVTLTDEQINALPTAIDDEVKAREQADTSLTEQLAESNTALAALKQAFDDFKAEYEQRDFVLESKKGSYPVGSQYVNYSDSRNPAEILGFGTWVAEAQGRVLIGAGSTTDSRGESLSFSAGATGGEFQHGLTKEEMPEHEHDLGTTGVHRADGGGDTGLFVVYDREYSGGRKTKKEGGGKAHNIIQPYKVAYIWRRTA